VPTTVQAMVAASTTNTRFVQPELILITIIAKPPSFK
jgi:hypothetical protein